MNTKMRLLFATTMLAAGIGLAQAQTPPAGDPHHPPSQAAGPAPKPMGPPPRGGAPMGPAGMQGGQGMMMGGDMAGMMAMMQMMRDGGMPMGMGANAARPFRHIEGQLAFWRAELHITEAEAPKWDAFAAAVRDNLGRMRETMIASMQATATAPAPDQLDKRIAALTAQAEAIKAVQAAVKPLYEALTLEQKKTADELMAEHMLGMRARGL